MTVETNESSNLVLTYASGEEVQVGDTIMEPVNGHERFGRVTVVCQPGCDEARLCGFPQGFIVIEWAIGQEYQVPAEGLHWEDCYFFVRRNAP